MKILKRNLLIFVFVPTLIFAHGTETHKKATGIEEKKELLVEEKKIVNYFKKINQEYLNNVKPIFEKKCFDCHSTNSSYPWYYKIPGIKQLIDYDAKKAKEHLDFTNDFPFLSHDTPINDLKSILKSTEEGTMPPLRYRVMHRDSKLNKTEIEIIKNWINNSLPALETNKKQ